jgi:mono/diheme cytochrome c family protein
VGPPDRVPVREPPARFPKAAQPLRAGLFPFYLIDANSLTRSLEPGVSALLDWKVIARFGAAISLLLRTSDAKLLQHLKGLSMSIRTKSSFAVAVTVAALTAFTIMSRHAGAADVVGRGKYLVTVGGCSDCHTPGTFLGKPNMSQFLGGSDVGFAIPGLGVFAGPNLTPDKETGLGNWTDAQIITAITTGKRPDGRILAPIMPYKALGSLTKEDAKAIVALSQKPCSRTQQGRGSIWAI